MYKPTIIPVVFDLESDPLRPLGTYLRMEEDSVLYRDPYGFRKVAPADCVKIVNVDLFPERLGVSTAADDLQRRADEMYEADRCQDANTTRDPSPYDAVPMSRAKAVAARRRIVTQFGVTDAPAEVAECEGHPAGPSDPMGETVYCDGSCKVAAMREP